jgi:hypothetical protein
MSEEIVTRALAGLAEGLADDDIDALVQMGADFAEASERLWAVSGRIDGGIPAAFSVGNDLLRTDPPADDV